MSNDPMDQQIDDQLVTHDDLPEVDAGDPLEDLPTNKDQELIADATDELIDEDVASEDLSVNDLVNDGVPVEELEPSSVGRRAMDDDLAHPQREDTIAERVRQEVPEQGFDVVPHNPSDPSKPGSGA